jgi:dCTP deaminase
MILSGEEIHSRLGNEICIDPFCEDSLNRNSYNLTLHHELLVYEEVVLDMKEPNRFRRLGIPDKGLILSPGQLYLARTVEYTETHGLVPMIQGRPNLARLGLLVHCSAAMGDAGFCGYWTLELSVVQPIRIYGGIRICQIAYHALSGSIRESRESRPVRAAKQCDIQPSMMFQELGYTREYEQLQLDFDSLASSSRVAATPNV